MISQRKRLLLSTLPSLVCLLVTTPALGSDSPSVPSLSHSQLERLAGGEILVEVVPGEVPVGDAIGVINAPTDRVLEVIRDFDSYSEFMNHMHSSRVLRREGDYYFCHGVTDTPWPMEDREWVLRAWGREVEVDGLDAVVVSWDYVPDSGNIEDAAGYWLIIPWGDGHAQTLLRYHVTIDLGSWLPDFLMEWGTENLLPEEIQSIRDRLGV